jgi:hypothetical protein
MSSPYLRPDAFVVMRYRAMDGSETEEIWNSRDGETPYALLLRSGKTATHVDWTTMVPRPDFEPPPGSRVFVDLTEEIARRNASAYVGKVWEDQGAEGMLARSQYPDKDAMVDKLVADIRPGEPALVTVPEGGWQR